MNGDTLKIVGLAALQEFRQFYKIIRVDFPDDDLVYKPAIEDEMP